MEANHAAALYDKYADMVYRLAFARTKNQYDADDIVQDVFYRFLRAKKQPENPEHEKALLLRITINCTKSLFRHAKRHPAEPLDETIAAVDAPRHETLDAVLRLPQKYRTVIHLHYYCGYSVEEIASVLSTKPSTVKTRLFRAREQLKQSLEGVEF